MFVLKSSSSALPLASAVVKQKFGIDTSFFDKFLGSTKLDTGGGSLKVETTVELNGKTEILELDLTFTPD